MTAASPAQAQDVAGMGTIYLTAAATNDPAAGNKAFVATDVAPTATTSQKAYIATSAMGSGYFSQFDWTVTDEFTVTGEFTIKIWVSCDVAALFAQGNTQGQTLAQSRGALMKGTTVVTEVTRTDAATTCNGPSSVRALEYKGDSKDTTYKAGEKLGIRIIFFTTTVNAAQTRNVHLLVNSTAHPSGITAAGLPSAGGDGSSGEMGSTPTYHNETLNGTTAEVRAGYENSTNALHNYNWTTNGTSFVISVDPFVDNGSVAVEILDGAGARVYFANFTSANNTEDGFRPPVLVNATAGSWRISANFTQFVGTLNVTIGVAPAQSATNATTSSSAGAAKETTSDGGVPGPAAGLLAASLLVAVLARRRRR